MSKQKILYHQHHLPVQVKVLGISNIWETQLLLRQHYLNIVYLAFPRTYLLSVALTDTIYTPKLKSVWAQDLACRVREAGGVQGSSVP